MYGTETWTVTRREEGYWREQKWECCGGYLESHWRIRKGTKSSERRWGGMHHWQNTRGQIVMVRSCDEKTGRTLHEKNYDGRGQRRPQWRAIEEAMGRHHTTRHEVSPFKERTLYCWLKEVERKDLSGWPLTSDGLIPAERRYILFRTSTLTFEEIRSSFKWKL